MKRFRWLTYEPGPLAPERVHQLFVFLAVFGCYLWSTPSSVVLGDDGYFVTAAYFNGMAHPPGYPLYMALAHLATLVPVGTVAFRVHALSGLFGALTCVALWRLANLLLQRRSLATLAALSFGFSAVFWSQAIIAKVYTLNTLLFFVLLYLAVHGTRAPDELSRGRILGFGLLYGLSLSNHWPLLILASPALVLVLWPVRRRLVRHWPAAAAGLAAGLTPYLWLIYRTHATPEFCYYGPISNWHDFWFYVSREGYRSVDRSLSAGWWDKAQFGGYVLRQTAGQFGPLGGALVLLGLVRQWRVWRAWECWGLLAGYLGGTFVLIGLLGFDYDALHRETFRAYPHLSYGICALWLGLGAQSLIEWLEPRLPGTIRESYARWGMVVVLVSTNWLVNAPQNYHARDHWTERYGRVLLKSLPAGAVLYANADSINGPVGYLHWVLGVRPDVELQSGRSFLFQGRLHRPYLLPAADAKALFDRFISDSVRPIFYTNDFPNSFAHDDYGMYLKVNRDKHAVSRTVIHPLILHFLQQIAARRLPNDPWEYTDDLLLREDYCRLWLNLHAREIVLLAGEAHRGVCDQYLGRLMVTQMLIDQGLVRSHPKLVHRQLEAAARLRYQALTKHDLARPARLAGEIALQEGDIARARRLFKSALAVWPDPRNPAALQLQQLGSHP